MKPSFGRHLNYLGPVSYFYLSWISLGFTIRGSCSGWWLCCCNILCLLKWQVTLCLEITLLSLQIGKLRQKEIKSLCSSCLCNCFDWVFPMWASEFSSTHSVVSIILCTLARRWNDMAFAFQSITFHWRERHRDQCVGYLFYSHPPFFGL